MSRTVNFTSLARPNSATIPNNYSLRIYYYNAELTEYNTAISATFGLTNMNTAWKQGGTGCALATCEGSTNGLIPKVDIIEVDYGTAGSGFYLGFNLNLNHFIIFAATSAGDSPLLFKWLTFTGGAYKKATDISGSWLRQRPRRSSISTRSEYQYII